MSGGAEGLSPAIAPADVVEARWRSMARAPESKRLIVLLLMVGGTSLFGGSGTVIGTFLGLIILQSISNGMVAAQIDPWWQTITIGLIMLFSVTVDVTRRRKRPIA